MLVWELREHELDTAVRLGREMHQHSRYAKYPFQPEKARDVLAALLGDPSSLVIGAFDGSAMVGLCCASVIDSLWFGCREVGDHFFFVTEIARGTGAGRALISRIEDWAALQNADVVTLSVSANIADEGAVKLLGAAGYWRIGTSYRKELPTCA